MVDTSLLLISDCVKQLLTDTPLKFIILFAVLVVIGLFIIFHPSENNKKQVKTYIESLGTNIFAIIVADLEYRVYDDDEVCNDNYESFKAKMIEEIYNDSWKFIQTYVESAIDNKELPGIAKIIVNKKMVENFVDVILGRKDIKDLFRDAYDHLTNETYQNMMKEEAKAKKAAEIAEKQPLEKSDPATDEVVEVFEMPKATEEQLAEVEEDYQEEEEDEESEPADDDNDPSTVG